MTQASIAWLQPATLAEALSMMASAESPRPYAGGTDILPLLHRDPHIESLRSQPRVTLGYDARVTLIGLSRIDELKGVGADEKWITIGSLTTHSEIAAAPLLREAVPVLVWAASGIGSPQVRNRGTLGGNLMNASPAADTVPPLIALGAEIALESSRGVRRIPLHELYLGPGMTCAAPDELLTSVRVPRRPPRPLQFFRRLAGRRSHACAKLSVAFCARRNDGVLRDVTIALGALGPKVLTAPECAALLEGQRLDTALIEKTSRHVQGEITPITDIRSTREYRVAMASELLSQGLLSLAQDPPLE